MTSRIKAVLGPTNTGKTHYALERMAAHASGIMGFPLRLLAREAYDKLVAIKGEASVGLITGEERIMPPTARWLLCTAEAMPTDLDTAFAAIDEVQLAAHPERGHIFTDRLLHLRGREETLILGSQAIAGMVRELEPDAEISTRPRFSQLRYAAPVKLSRLQPRTAIIAFSTEDVYEIAEEMRRARGGAAIVMGNLSPRTRNAQVAMYQAGEVDFVVATDAIGMGLNMDIDHVVFASLGKYDGRKRRRLRVDEMAQIAGRAGRHHRDGSFGTLNRGDKPPLFTPDEIDRIEDHRFDRHDWVYWRSRDLEFADPDALLASLTTHADNPVLRTPPPADDIKVLRYLADDPLLSARNWTEAATRRLWDACGLPDFRNAGTEQHAQLVQRLHTYLGQGSGRIPEAVLLGETARLDRTSGDVSELATRLAGIRTWAYAANRKDWLPNPQAWVEKTRDIERRLSDTLHARLVERFVERRASRLARATDAAPSVRDIGVDEDGTLRVFDEAIGRVSGLKLTIDRLGADKGRQAMMAHAERYWAGEVARMGREMAAAPPEVFTLQTVTGEVPALLWRDMAVARLERGRALLDPKLALAPELAALDVKLRDPLLTAMRAGLTALITKRLAALIAIRDAAFDPASPPAARALLATMLEEGGFLPRLTDDPLTKALTPHDRAGVRRLGVIIGALGMYHRALIKPEAIRLRLALHAAYRLAPMPPLPMAGLPLLDQPAPALASAALRAGYVRLGDTWLRVDLADRIANALHKQREATPEFRPDPQLATAIGLGQATYVAMLHALGFTPAGKHAPDLWKWRGRARPPRQRARPSKRREVRRA